VTLAVKAADQWEKQGNTKKNGKQKRNKLSSMSKNMSITEFLKI
jgi:hypothetical protein